ncbi:MAG: Hpt domain-containing protein [Opitutaceae bacterium]|nr:Hpt domain-containing protein [Opitutaceae bacterium]
MPPSPYAPDLPSLDPERVEMLRELCLDAGPDALHEMLGSWESEAARHLAEAQAALAKADLPALKASAHSIKGSCSNMGIVRLSELGRQLEHHSADPSISSELLTQMGAEFERAKGLLSELTAQT